MALRRALLLCGALRLSAAAVTCPAGTYSVEYNTGPGPCTPCPPGLSSRAGSTSCGAVVKTLAGGVTSGFVDGAASVARLLPYGVALNYPGNASVLFVADGTNNALRAVSLSNASYGFVTTVVGRAGNGFANGAAAVAKFNTVHDVTTDGLTAWVADQGNNLVRAINVADPTSTSYGFTTTLAGGGGGSQNNVGSGNVDATGTNAYFNNPQSVAYSCGIVYVSDRNNNAIRAVTVPYGTVSTLASGLSSPGYLSLSANGKLLYVPDSVGLRSITISAETDTLLGVVTTLSGPVGTSGASASATTVFTVSSSIEVTAVNIHTKQVSVAIAGPGSANTNGIGTAAGFSNLRGVEFDPSSAVIYAADSTVGTSGVVRILSTPVCPAGTMAVVLKNPVVGPSASYPACQPCGANTYSAAGATSCDCSCPVGTCISDRANATSAGTCTPCAAVEASTSPAATVTTTNIFFASSSSDAGSQCTVNATCASGVCLGGACCNAVASALNCSGCALQTGSCLTRSPGETCAVSADCASDLCLGGCCCAGSALVQPRCTSCACFSPSTPSASLGTCTALAPAPTSSQAACAANSSAAGNATIAAQLFAFPSSLDLNATATPLLVLSSASALVRGGRRGELWTLRAKPPAS